MSDQARVAMGSGEGALAPDAGRKADGRSEALVVAGSILGALAASSCCVLPLLLVSLGVSGAWIGNLTALAPYQPYILALTFLVLGYGFCSVHWRPRQICRDGTCQRSLPRRGVKFGLWVGTLLVAIALIFPRLALWLAGG